MLHPWAWPDSPWKRIYGDFAGPFMGLMFMVVVDAHSKWLEVIPMSTTTTEKTLDALRNLFAAYGIPQQLVSDNAPQRSFKNVWFLMEFATHRVLPITLQRTGLLNDSYRLLSIL